jgi:hypothetical protein
LLYRGEEVCSPSRRIEGDHNAERTGGGASGEIERKETEKFILKVSRADFLFPISE